jgi:hypothetical protein
MLRLRRSPWLRLLAVLLLIGSPGLGGAGLQAMHGCTERMPWLADGAANGSSDHHGGDHDQAPADEGCHCIGECQAGAAVAVLAEGGLAQADELPAVRSAPTGASRVAPAGRIAHRLPPATAPPLI